MTVDEPRPGSKPAASLTGDQRAEVERASAFLAAASEGAAALAEHLDLGPAEDTALFYATDGLGVAQYHVAELLAIIAGFTAAGRKPGAAVPPPAAGPFETEQEARELPAVRAIYNAMHVSTRPGVMATGGHKLLDEACTAAGVELGAYDHRILLWLAGFEPHSCAVIAGLITRAAGTAAPGARLAELRDYLTAVLDDGDRDRQYALEYAERELTAICEQAPAAGDGGQ
jgi:hypothetical protein